jgi:uncharacterized protein YjbJ (UPF0337 family)
MLVGVPAGGDPEAAPPRCCTPGMVRCPGGTALGMSAQDKASNKIDELAGKAKEVVGRATDDPELEAEGKGEQARSNLKQAGEKVKDAFS